MLREKKKTGNNEIKKKLNLNNLLLIFVIKEDFYLIINILYIFKTSFDFYLNIIIKKIFLSIYNNLVCICKNFISPV